MELPWSVKWNHFGPRWSLGIGALSAFLAALAAALMIAKPVARKYREIRCLALNPTVRSRLSPPESDPQNRRTLVTGSRYMSARSAATDSTCQTSTSKR